MIERCVTLDSVARLLAAQAGVAWRRLPDYPGFSRGRWRDLARWMISRAAPEASIVEGTAHWDGTLGDDLVRGLSSADALQLVDAWHSASASGCRPEARWAKSSVPA